MKISDLFVMCVQNLRRRKFRTLLTVIGVVIGTCAIISMISIGIGINKSNSDFISSWGDLSMIDIYGSMGDTVINDEMLSTIRSMEGVDAVTPFVQVYSTDIPYDGKILAGKKDRYEMNVGNLVGVYPDSLEKLGYTLAEGEMLPKNPRYISLVIGSDVPYDFQDSKRKYPNNMISPFPDNNGVTHDPFVNMREETLTIKIPYGGTGDNEKYLVYPAKVTGVLREGDANSWETRNNIYIDITDLKRIETEYQKISKSKNRQERGYGQVKVHVDTLDLVSDVQKSIEEMGLMADSLESNRQDAMQQTQQMQIILGGLGAISLLVAAISIANTMVMSVYERTREIGVMKVLGCFVSDIRKIFLVEAALIGFFGGLIGVALSFFISFLLNNFGGNLGAAMGLIDNWGEAANKISVIPPWLVLLGMGFATLIGIVAGLYPAYRAVRISALEAIKQD